MKPKILNLLIIFTAGLQVLAASALGAVVTNQDCATCHAGISAEWTGSLHSGAWTSPVFAAELEKRSAVGETSCDCHGPQSIAGNPGVRPAMRENSPHGGVTCLTCHVDSDQTIHSSGEPMTVPHFTVQEPAYATAEVCSGCHPVAADNEYDCQVCHMPETGGGAADGPHLEKVPGASHRDHTFPGSRDPQMIASGLAMKVESGGEIRVEVVNLVDAHHIPITGQHRLEVALNGNAGQPLGREQVKLEAGATVELLFPPAGASTVELRFYPGPEVWPDSFYVIQREVLEK